MVISRCIFVVDNAQAEVTCHPVNLLLGPTEQVTNQISKNKKGSARNRQKSFRCSHMSSRNASLLTVITGCSDASFFKIRCFANHLQSFLSPSLPFILSPLSYSATDVIHSKSPLNHHLMKTVTLPVFSVGRRTFCRWATNLIRPRFHRL